MALASLDLYLNFVGTARPAVHKHGKGVSFSCFGHSVVLRLPVFGLRSPMITQKQSP